MDPYRLPFALLMFLGFVAVVPAWLYFVTEYAPDLTMEAEFLAGMALPAILVLGLASWLQPRVS